jgi:DNA-binding NarL/FixJ family response regulator
VTDTTAAYVCVPAELRTKHEAACYSAGFDLVPVATGPTQAPRFTLRGTGSTVHPLAGNGLTDREFQVLHGMSQGLSNAKIGRQLELSEDTIKTHARRLFRKLGARDRAHAVQLGHTKKILGGGS